MSEKYEVLLHIWKVLNLILGSGATNADRFFSGFPHYLPGETYLKIGYDHFLPHPPQFITHITLPFSVMLLKKYSYINY